MPNQAFARCESGGPTSRVGHNHIRSVGVRAIPSVGTPPPGRYVRPLWTRPQSCVGNPYRIEPTASGCRVTEWSEDLRPDSVLEFSEQMSGVSDRAARNQHTMSGTLERLAAALEV